MLIWAAPCLRASAQQSDTPAGAEKPLSMRRSQIRIKMEEAGPEGLAASLYVPNTPGLHPLALMTHGTEYSTGANRQIGPGMYEPEALWFVRRNWAVLIVVRRGYGDSGGQEERMSGGCSEAGYTASAHAAALDLKTALEAVEGLPGIDPDRAIVLGSSAGGFASVALGAEAPPELKAVINFEGGWHSMLFSGTCAKGLYPVFRSFGGTTKVPSLWFYAKNDQLFRPKYVAQIYDAFTSGGGTAQLKLQQNRATMVTISLARVRKSGGRSCRRSSQKRGCLPNP
jgi:dienelactone hydrolase